jgi:hypothetical protein
MSEAKSTWSNHGQASSTRSNHGQASTAVKGYWWINMDGSSTNGLEQGKDDLYHCRYKAIGVSTSMVLKQNGMLKSIKDPHKII